jgi:hypothetical protein
LIEICRELPRNSSDARRCEQFNQSPRGVAKKVAINLSRFNREIADRSKSSARKIARQMIV